MVRSLDFSGFSFGVDNLKMGDVYFFDVVLKTMYNGFEYRIIFLELKIDRLIITEINLFGDNRILYIVRD